MLHHSQVDDCVELICSKGCLSVREDIARLENSEKISEIKGLNADQVAQVLLELQEVMSAYEGTCPLPNAE